MQGRGIHWIALSCILLCILPGCEKKTRPQCRTNSDCHPAYFCNDDGRCWRWPYEISETITEPDADLEADAEEALDSPEVEREPDFEIENSGPLLDPNPSEVDFGIAMPGMSFDQDLYLFNAGNRNLEIHGIWLDRMASDEGEFEWEMFRGDPPTEDTPIVLEPARYAGVIVTYEPEYPADAFGCYNDDAELVITSNDRRGTDVHVALTSFEYGTPMLWCRPDPLEFHSTGVGGSESQTVTCVVDYSDSRHLLVDVVELEAGTSSEFSVEPPAGMPVDLAPDDSFVIEVTYSPVDLVADTGTLRVHSSSCRFPEHRVTLSGFPDLVEISVGPLEADFGDVCRTDGSTQTLRIDISNSGLGTLVIQSVVITEDGNGAFSIASAPDSTVTAGNSTSMEITFAPTELNTQPDQEIVGWMEIRSNDKDKGTILVELRGRAVGPPCGP